MSYCQSMLICWRQFINTHRQSQHILAWGINNGDVCTRPEHIATSRSCPLTSLSQQLEDTAIAGEPSRQGDFLI